MEHFDANVLEFSFSLKRKLCVIDFVQRIWDIYWGCGLWDRVAYYPTASRLQVNYLFFLPTFNDVPLSDFEMFRLIS